MEVCESLSDSYHGLDAASVSDGAQQRKSLLPLVHLCSGEALLVLKCSMGVLGLHDSLCKVPSPVCVALEQQEFLVPSRC